MRDKSQWKKWLRSGFETKSYIKPSPIYLYEISRCDDLPYLERQNQREKMDWRNIGGFLGTGVGLRIMS